MSVFEHQLIGSGNTNVLFFNGFRMNFDTWGEVYPRIAQKNKVLLFNRAGVGRSPKAPAPQTGDLVLDGIRTIAFDAGLEPPYIVVCHSIGGVFANLYARLFPSEVAGVAFVESPHPLEIPEQKRIKPPLLLHVLNEGVKTMEKVFHQHKFSEDECIFETLRQLEHAGSFPDIPISVVTGGKRMPLVPKHAHDLHIEFQQQLLGLSNQSRHFLCENSGHFPQITDSDVVIKAIEYVLHSASSSDRTGACY